MKIVDLYHIINVFRSLEWGNEKSNFRGIYSVLKTHSAEFESKVNQPLFTCIKTKLHFLSEVINRSGAKFFLSLDLPISTLVRGHEFESAYNLFVRQHPNIHLQNSQPRLEIHKDDDDDVAMN